jgi:DNA-binding LacI/PurR family transcriptional regulator
MATIKDIAEKAGNSIGTMDRILSRAREYRAGILMAPLRAAEARTVLQGIAAGTPVVLVDTDLPRTHLRAN